MKSAKSADSKCKIGTLLFFIYQPSSAFKHDPLATLFADNSFFAASNHRRDYVFYLVGNHIVHLDFLRVPQSHIIGVSKQGTFIPEYSP